MAQNLEQLQEEVFDAIPADLLAPEANPRAHPPDEIDEAILDLLQLSYDTRGAASGVDGNYRTATRQHE